MTKPYFKSKRDLLQANEFAVQASKEAKVYTVPGGRISVDQVLGLAFGSLNKSQLIALRDEVNEHLYEQDQDPFNETEI